MINKMFENFDVLLYLKNSLYPGFNDDENTDYLSRPVPVRFRKPDNLLMISLPGM